MVINNFLPFIGGAEVQAHKLSKQLLRNGHTVNVLTSKWSGDHLPSSDTIENVKVYRVPCPFIKIGRKQIGQSFFTFCQFLYVLGKCASNYDIIHVHQALRPALAAAIAGKMFSRPTLCKIGNSGNLFDLRRYKKVYIEGQLGVKGIIKYIDAFVSISTKITHTLADFVKKEKIVSIPNGVDLVHPTFSKESRLGGKTRVISIGSLTNKKNFDLMIDAIGTLETNVKENIEVKILGDGPEREALQHQITKLNLDGTISLLGNVSDIGNHLQNSDLFMLVSKAEGMSNALLEALSFGLPVICSDVGNNAELVGISSEPEADDADIHAGRCGLIIGSVTQETIREGLEAFLALSQQAKVEMGGNASSSVKTFSIQNVALEYEKLYEYLRK